MAQADGVRSEHLLHVPQPTLPHFGRDDGAQYPGIVVQADTLHLHPASVERKAFVGVEGQRAEPYAGRGGR